MIFLSYNRSDSAEVARIQSELRASGVNVFYDRDRLTPGLPWPVALEEGLRGADAVAVFLGPSGTGVWQKREIGFALDRQAQEEGAQRAFPVIPVLLPGAVVTTSFLFLNTWIDLRNGGDSSQGIRQLLEAAQGPGPAEHQSEPIPGFCPYIGLRPFREEDAGLFFGREAVVDQLVENTLQLPFVAVVGPSGSGKSSVVRAGLLPRLRRQRPPRATWDATAFHPTTHPWYSLATALTRMLDTELTEARLLEEAGGLARSLEGMQVPLSAICRRILERSGGTDRLLLVADQFEELFTLAPQAQHVPVLESLLEATHDAPVTLVVTLRGDFYGRAIQASRMMSDALQRGVVNLGPPQPAELRRAIVEPARRAGLEFDSGLVDRIQNDVGSSAGNLPLLEYALTSLWETRSGRRLTHDGYSAIGEVQGSIGKRAQDAYDNLTAAEQAAARRLFSRLVRVASATEEGTDARRRAFREEVGPAAWSVALRLADVPNRLLVTSRDPESGQETVEVAHEALLRSWSLLRDWVEQDRTFLLWQQRLQSSVEAWTQSKKSSDLLLRGPQLKQALAFGSRRRELLSPTELAFLRASDRASVRNRITRIAAVVVLGLLTGAAIAVSLYLRSDNYAALRSIDDVPLRRVIGGDSTQAAGEFLAALGFLNRPHEFDLLMTATVPVASRWVEHLRPSKEPDAWAQLDRRIPRVVLEGMVAGGHTAEAARLAKSLTGDADRACAMTALAGAQVSLGSLEIARSLVSEAERVGPPNSATAGDRAPAAGCLAEAAIRIGDHERYLKYVAVLTSRPDTAEEVLNESGVLAALLTSTWMDDLARFGVWWTRRYRLGLTQEEMTLLNRLIQFYVYHNQFARASELIDSLPPWSRDRETHLLVVDALNAGQFASAESIFRANPRSVWQEDLIKLVTYHATRQEIPRALELVGHLETSTIPARAAAESAISRASVLLLAGRVPEATRLILATDSVALRPTILETAFALASDSLLDRSLDLINQLPDSISRSGAYQSLIESLMVADRLGPASQLLDRIAPYLDSYNLRNLRQLLALQWLALGDTVAAKSEITGGATDPLHPFVISWETVQERRYRAGTAEQDMTLGRAIRTLRRSGLKREADTLLMQLDQSVESTRDEVSRSRSAALVSRLLAEAGRLREAREAATRCTFPDDRAVAYGAILTAYATLKYPELKARIEHAGGVDSLLPSLREPILIRRDMALR